MKHRLLALLLSWVAWLALAAVARAEADFVILGERNAFWTNNTAAPVCKRLASLQKLNAFHSVSFALTGDWVILPEGHGFSTNNRNLAACKKLAELQKRNAAFHCVAFAPAGGWSLLWNQNGNWTIGPVPDAAFQKMQDVVKAGATLRSLAFGPGGSWVLLYDQAGVKFGGVPDDLAKVLNDASQQNATIHCVCFLPSGGWICLASNGWTTSDRNHPASKMIARLDRERHALRWVAVAPEVGAHDFEKWTAVIRRHHKADYPGGYAFAVLHKGEVVAEGAEGLAREAWQPAEPNVKWTVEKPMGIASLSKTVTAVALLKLWEERDKKFSLDGPFWPHIRAICPKASDGAKKVTIRQLLQHKSGFKKVGSCNSPKDLEKLLEQPLEHKPGTNQAYDNNNYYAARLVLEQIGKVDYTAYVKEHVLRPMGITGMETHFEAHEPTCGYGKPGSKRPGFPFNWNCARFAGPDGWYASIRDMSRFLVGLRDHKVLSVATTKMMDKDLLGWDIAYPGWEKNGGWFWDEGKKPNSRAGGLRSSLYHFPDDVDAVMFINSEAGDDPEAILREAWTESMRK
jgi:CubicO group peptidase (beta-lactamase class C family)